MKASIYIEQDGNLPSCNFLPDILLRNLFGKFVFRRRKDLKMKKTLRIMMLTLTMCLALTMAACAQQTKLIALTFDDGPSGTCTPQVLDILKEKDVKATFFLVGKWLGGGESLVKREVKEGHQVANHTYQHQKLTTLSDAAIRSGISQTNTALTKITGLSNFMVRPPFGARDARVAADVDAPLILWSVDAASGKQLSAQQLVKNVAAGASDGGIILLHDTTQANVDAVAPIIDKLHSRGYEFVTVRELFRLRGITPQKHGIYKRIVNATPQNYNEAYLSSHWAYHAIQDLKANGVMAGDRSGWHPNHYLTRAQAVTILWRADGSPATASRYSFSDVPVTAYYAKACAWARGAGIAQGMKTGRFLPDRRVTREQFCVMMARLAQLQGKSSPRTDSPASCGDDARIDAWAKPSVEVLRKMGFASKNDVELFRPRDWATRAEVAELLDWYLHLS
jgi:peptidoglycan/xylan/chitin deacetylase (PgdA/CDA1 family)